MELYNADCLTTLRELINAGVKVNAIITDPPYELTQNKWDNMLPLDKLWELLKEIRADERVPIILFGSQPFTSKLIMSNLPMFKYTLYWRKDRPSGFLNAKKQPLRDVEDIIVFYEKQCYYNPQMWTGKPLHSLGTAYKDKKSRNNNYNEFNCNTELRNGRKGSTDKYPRQVLEYNRPHPPIHPTQKPLELMKYLIKTYTNEGDLVLDFTMGSGTTGVACRDLNRRFIGIELNKEYFNIAKERIENGRSRKQ